MRLVWCTDIHLNFLKRADAPKAFIEYVRSETACDAIVVTGDITEAQLIDPHLAQILSTETPVYFVLGNHDYYNSSFSRVNQLVTDKYGTSWLGHPASYVKLTDNTVLIGQDGWYDARAADPYKSTFDMSDWFVIADFRGLNKDGIVRKCREMAGEQAQIAKIKLEKAAKEYKNIIFATHYPPFIGASWHQGKVSDKAALPWFASTIMGEALLDIATKFPNVKFDVLCGHCHSSGIYKPIDNVIVKTGAARYGFPDIAGVLEIE